MDRSSHAAGPPVYRLLSLVVLAVLADFALATGPADRSSSQLAEQPRTLEDIYGDSGDTFQGGIGFLTLEGTTVPDRSFGLAIDDVVMRWREFSLVEDGSDCLAGGSCAVIDVDSVFQFTANESIEVSVLDACPYGPDGVNNCNADRVCSGTTSSCVIDGDCPSGSCSSSGAACNAFYDCPDPYIENCIGGSRCLPDYTDAEDDTDCDDDGVQDVVVHAVIDVTSDPDGAELVVLNRVPGAAPLYRGELAVSATGNSVGVLFVTPIGTDGATVTFEYLDEDDCTGQSCRNDVDPRGWGIVDVDTQIVLNTCSMALVSLVPIADNGDDDGFADANETVDLQITVINNCGIDLSGCAAHLTTGDPSIDCLLDPTIELGDIPSGAGLQSSDTGTIRVADVVRTNVDDLLAASFGVAISCDQFDAISVPLSATLDLDLDLDLGGQQSTTFFEGFEGGLGSFQPNDLDAGIPPDFAAGENEFHAQLRADGMRCQYNDPSLQPGSSFPEEYLDCYPGSTLARADMVHWRPDGAAVAGSPDGGRAYQGNGSLYWGEFLDPTLGFTVPFASVEAVELTQPLGIVDTAAELRWFQQVDLVDSRSVNAPPGESADRGVVQIQVVDVAGVPTTPWARLEPYFNGYDQQGTDNYTNCLFDPIDDGTTEDDYFDPTDPDRRFGPSSTCFPMFSYVYQGDTFSPFDSANVGNATSGPGLAGSLGTGTWVETRVNLSQYVGQRIKLRFLETGLKVGTTETIQQAFQDEDGLGWNPTPGDDGWWIDSLSVTETVLGPLSRSVDTNDNTALPVCGTTCNSVTVDTAVIPPSAVTAAPGQVVELDASGSVADRCVDGVLQYRFSARGEILRSWTDDPVLLDAPIVDTSYTVEVRCSSDPSCAAAQVVPVTVDCPGGSTRTIVALDSSTFEWDGSSLLVDRAVGSFSLSTEIAPYAATVTDAIGPSTTVNLSQTPAPGSGLWMLIKRDGPIDGVEFCNGRTWRSGGHGEPPEPARDTTLGN